MRRTGIGAGAIARGIFRRGCPPPRAGWLALVAAIGGWHCAVDSRSPKEKEVVTAEMPSGGGADGARFSKVPSGGAAGSDAVAQTGGAAGTDGSTAGSTGMGSGGTGSGAAGSTANGGSAGSDNTGSGNTGNSAGSTGMTPPGAGGAPPAGDLPDDPFSGLGDFGSQGNASGAAGASSTTGNSGSTCPGFDACGGALDGTWTYSNVCIEPSANSADLLTQVCPTASVTYERGGTSTLTFSGSSVSRTGSPVGDSVITFPTECTEGFGCSLFAGAFADCADMGSVCICRTPTSVDWGTQSYTTTGGTLSLGNGRSFDYCVQGNTLTYRETGDVQEAGTNTLQRN